DGVRPIVQVRRGRTSNGLAYTSSKRIILEAGCRSAANRGQVISRIPAICLRTVTGHVAVCIIANRASAPLGKLVIHIIGCRVDGLGTPVHQYTYEITRACCTRFLLPHSLLIACLTLW